MLSLRTFSAAAMVAMSVSFAACGSLSDSTECTVAGACSDASTPKDTTPADSTPPQDTQAEADTHECNPGDTKKQGCNDCICNVDGVFVCTKNSCCPDKAPADGADCTGDTHCIYTTPCSFGCDCVKGKWLCGVCP